MKLFSKLIVFIFFTLLLAACSKGYEVRITNYYTEDMDTVIVGNKIIYTNVTRPSTTDYVKIEKGTHPVTFITKTKKVLESSINIPKNKSGKRTIQIDGQGTVLILKD
jgi:hypothetical protein